MTCFLEDLQSLGAFRHGDEESCSFMKDPVTAMTDQERERKKRRRRRRRRELHGEFKQGTKFIIKVGWVEM